MKMFEFRAHNNRYTSFHRPSQGACRSMLAPKFFEYIVILCFERHYPKQNSVIRLKSNILPPNVWVVYQCCQMVVT